MKGKCQNCDTVGGLVVVYGDTGLPKEYQCQVCTWKEKVASTPEEVIRISEIGAKSMGQLLMNVKEGDVCEIQTPKKRFVFVIKGLSIT